VLAQKAVQGTTGKVPIGIPSWAKVLTRGNQHLWRKGRNRIHPMSIPQPSFDMIQVTAHVDNGRPRIFLPVEPRPEILHQCSENRRAGIPPAKRHG
jgi:hypothetical protein